MAEAIVLARRTSFRIGSAEIRPAACEVIGPGGRSSLEPRVMQVLVALAEADGATVTRDDLTTRCWGGRIVGEDAITRVLVKLRRISRDVAGGSFAIETIRKVGYRLAVNGALGSDEDSLGRADSTAAAAAILLVRARDALGYMMPERDVEAAGLLKEAVTLSPDDATIWARLAAAHQRIAEYGLPEAAEASRERAVAAARRALYLDPGCTDASAVLALLPPTHRNWAEREAAFNAVLAADPRHVGVLAVLARLQLEVGRVDDSVATMAQAFALDQMAPSNYWRRALGLWSAGGVEEACSVTARGLELWPRQNLIWFVRFWILASSGRAGEALLMAGDRATRPLDVPEQEYDRAMLAARALDARKPSDVDATVASYREAARRHTTGAEVGMGLASTFGALDESFAIAEAYFFGRGFDVPAARMSAGMYHPLQRRNSSILFWPTAAAMRADRRFAALTEELGLDGYWRATGIQPDFKR